MVGPQSHLPPDAAYCITACVAKAEIANRLQHSEHKAIGEIRTKQTYLVQNYRVFVQILQDIGKRASGAYRIEAAASSAA